MLLPILWRRVPRLLFTLLYVGNCVIWLNGSRKLKVPDNITILPLPPKSPELNPVENIWQFMRDNWLSNRVFKSYNDIVDHCCYAWNLLCDQPWKILSIGMRDWAHRS